MIARRKVGSSFIAALALCAGLFGATQVLAAKSTTATSAGNWNDAIWNNGAPADGDDVAIDNGVTVTLSNSSPQLNAFTVSGSLVFSNWDTKLSSTAVTIIGSATLPPAFTGAQMSNRVYFACSNLTLASGASINVTGKGYAGGLGTPSPTAGSGPGGGCVAYDSGGASYAGLGQAGVNNVGLPGPIYGVKEAPLDPGSGGGGRNNDTTAGGAGGGAVRVEASGTVTVNGAINAGGNVGGGSGGSIYITCRIFAGTNGVLSADGGDGGWNDAGSYGGAGSAGRIAVVCNEAAQNGAARPTVTIRTKVAYGNVDWGPKLPCSIGTVYLNVDRAVPDLAWGSDASLSGFTNYTPTTLTVTNGSVIFEQRVAIVVAGNLSVTGPGRLELHDPNLTVAGDSILSNASLYVYAGTNNTGPGRNYDSSVTVGGTIFLGNGWIYPISDPTNGGAIKFTAGSVNISDTNSGFFADALGYAGGPSNLSANGFGPGGGASDGIADGGGYGGIGGDGYWGAVGGNGATYGVSNAPVLPGSGGGGSSGSFPAPGGAGGGLIWIEAPKGTLTMNGIMTAKGAAGRADGGGQGGGSGGGIYLICKSLVGAADRKLSADGGYGGSFFAGGGGGGRIAVFARSTNDWLGTATVNRGIGAGGNTGNEDPSHAWAWSTDGTVVWGLIKPSGTIIDIK